MVVLLLSCKNYFPLPNIFSSDVHMWEYSLRVTCWSKLSVLRGDNEEFLTKMPEIGHWKIESQTERFCIQNHGQFWLSLATFFIFSPLNKTWLTPTSVFPHTGNICLPATLVPRRICRAGSQVCAAWGLQAERIKLHHTQRGRFGLVPFGCSAWLGLF